MRSSSTQREPQPDAALAPRNGRGVRALAAVLSLLAGVVLAAPTPAPAAMAPQALPGREAAAPETFPGRMTSQAAQLPLPGRASAPHMPRSVRSLLPSPSSILPLNAMREDLASRLALDRITVVAFEQVTWPDACLGVYEPGAVCAQLLTPGFLAILAAEGLSSSFAYHGVDQYFIPAPFIENATLTLPLEVR